LLVLLVLLLVWRAAGINTRGDIAGVFPGAFNGALLQNSLSRSRR
jgi:hypothetical protein